MSYELRNQIRQPQILAQLHELTDPDAEIVDYYRDAFAAYRGGEWDAVTRHVGLMIENLTTLIRDEVYPEISTTRQGVIDRMVSDDDRPLMEYIGKTLEPAYWLRHQSSHDDMPYTVEQADAHFALLCFQIALNTYVEDFLGLEVNW